MTTIIDGSGSATFATPLPVAQGGTGRTNGVDSTAPSMVRLNTANGFGSTNTRVRRFTNVVTNQGSDITYADSASSGASFTVNTSGVYAISFSDHSSTANSMGLTLNIANPTITLIQNAAASELLMANTSANVNYGMAVTWIGYLSASSIIRAHCDGVSGANTTFCQFTMTRVA